MVTTMFTACGKADSPAASETEGQNTAENNTESGEKETIEFWDMIWGSDADAYEATVREICEQVGEEIGANVEVRFLPWDNFTQRIILFWMLSLRKRLTFKPLMVNL